MLCESMRMFMASLESNEQALGFEAAVVLVEATRDNLRMSAKESV